MEIDRLKELNPETSKEDFKIPPSKANDPQSLDINDVYEKRDVLLLEIEKLNKNISAIEHSYSVSLHSIDEKEIESQEAMLKVWMSDCTKIGLKVKSSINSLEAETEALASNDPLSVSSAGGGSSAIIRLRRSIHQDILQKFTKSMKRYQKIQKEANLKSKIQLQRQYLLIKPNATKAELEEVAEAAGSMSLTSQQVLSIAQSENSKKYLEKMKERRKNIMKIERGVSNLNQLAFDLNVMVEEQGETINNIQGSFHQAVEYTEAAGVSMSDAVEIQKNIRRLRCSIAWRTVINDALGATGTSW